MKSKKGISVMIGYVLLIALVISVSFAVYQMVKSYVPKTIQECPEDVSIAIDRLNCTGGKINVDVINNGLFDIRGYTIRGETADGRVVDLVNEYYYFAEPLSPNTNDIDSEMFGGQSAETINSVEIIPLRIQEEQTVICGNFRVKKDLVPGCQIDGSGTSGIECSFEGQCAGENICNSSGKWTPHCGDAVTNCYEECDDGNFVSGDGCSNSCRKESCSDWGGYICNATEFCPGIFLAANDTERCCNLECTDSAGDFCSECGEGLFNLCDLIECHSISQGCYFEGGLLNTCTNCSIMTCGEYSDADCVGDRCGLGCDFDGSNCIDVGCGNTYCNTSETCSTCDADCGCCYGACDGSLICDINKNWIVHCGDGTCNCGETSATCNDCPSTCGDGLCTIGETCSSCSYDCGECDGTACNVNADCKSGYCTDGICCKTPCNGVCETCAIGTGICTLSAAGTDPDLECSPYTCTNYLFGLSGIYCYRYSSATANNGDCNGAGACSSVTASCTGQGSYSASCGEWACLRSGKCITGALATTCDTTSELCYVNNEQASCATHYRCDINGYCSDGAGSIATGCFSSGGSTCDTKCAVLGYHSCASAWINSCSGYEKDCDDPDVDYCKCYTWLWN